MDTNRIYIYKSTLHISNGQGTTKFVRDIESLTYQVVILCKLIRMGPIVLFETSRVRFIRLYRRKHSIFRLHNYFSQYFWSKCDKNIEIFQKEWVLGCYIPLLRCFSHLIIRSTISSLKINLQIEVQNCYTSFNNACSE